MLKLPSLKKVRRISINDQTKYFAGTDFTYEDTRQLIGEQTKNYDYQLLEQSSEFWKIAAIPKSNVKTGYSKRVLWIDNKFATTKIEYYIENNQLLKTQINRQIDFEENGLWRVNQVEIDNPFVGRRTFMKIINRKINSGLSQNIFTKKFLESKRR